MKFDFKFSKEKIDFLDTLVYKNHNNRLQTIINKKSTDRQNYFHANSAHPLSPKRSISYLWKKGKKEPSFETKSKKIDGLERSTLLNKTDAVRKNVILSVLHQRYFCGMDQIREPT